MKSEEYLILTSMNWVDLPTLLFGLERGWLDRFEIEQFIAARLLPTSDSPIVLDLASGNFEDERECQLLLIRLIGDIDNKTLAKRKWMYAHLRTIDESHKTEIEKIEALQDVFSTFDFDSEVRELSVYYEPNAGTLQIGSPTVSILESLSNVKLRLLASIETDLTL